MLVEAINGRHALGIDDAVFLRTRGSVQVSTGASAVPAKTAPRDIVDVPFNDFFGSWCLV